MRQIGTTGKLLMAALSWLRSGMMAKIPRRQSASSVIFPENQYPLFQIMH
jgi:hypothetical protein